MHAPNQYGLADYIADHYGACGLDNNCECLKPGKPWLGRACAHWKPVEARTWEELIELVRKRSKRRRC